MRIDLAITAEDLDWETDEDGDPDDNYVWRDICQRDGKHLDESDSSFRGKYDGGHLSCAADSHPKRFPQLLALNVHDSRIFDWSENADVIVQRFPCLEKIVGRSHKWSRVISAVNQSRKLSGVFRILDHL